MGLAALDLRVLGFRELRVLNPTTGRLHRHQQPLSDCLPAESWRDQRERRLRDKGPSQGAQNLGLGFRV